MNKPTPVLLSLFAVVGGCAGSGGSDAPIAPSFGARDQAFESHGLRIERPADWVFVQPDKSVSQGALVLLQGPIGRDALAPQVTVVRRPLSAADRRRKPSHILSAHATEVVQTYAAFEALGAPTEMELDGHPAALLRMKLAETLPEGGEVERLARLYAIVHGDQVWLLHMDGAADGSDEDTFDSLISSMTLRP